MIFQRLDNLISFKTYDTMSTYVGYASSIVTKCVALERLGEYATDEIELHRTDSYFGPWGKVRTEVHKKRKTTQIEDRKMYQHPRVELATVVFEDRFVLIVSRALGKRKDRCVDGAFPCAPCTKLECPVIS